MNENNWIRTRKLQLDKISRANLDRLQKCLESLSAVTQSAISVEKSCIYISYDIRLTKYADIIKALEDANFTYKNSWTNKIKAHWASFVDQTARQNSQRPPAACCNHAPHQPKLRKIK